MTATTRECNAAEAGGLLQRLMQGMSFAGFRFDTSFGLRFTGEVGDGRPFELELRIEADWGFGTPADWAAAVSQMAPPDSAQPEEPVQAYKLALLRWAPGNEVVRVALGGNLLEVTMASGTTVFSACTDAGGDFAWRLVEPGVTEGDERWSVVCSGDGSFFLRTPEL